MKKGILKIEKVMGKQSIPYALLLLADPSIHQINDYLQSGICYVARLENEVIGVFVLNQITPSSIEIKNIAISELFQGNGFGKQLLQFAEEVSQQSGYKKLIIGTGNSSIAQLALYQKAGFEIVRIEKDFFVKNYNEPIMENGIPCKHMIILEKELDRQPL
jgi:ribosomal protein S18 acetylase RimI-like enzyme